MATRPGGIRKMARSGAAVAIADTQPYSAGFQVAAEQGLASVSVRKTVPQSG